MLPFDALTYLIDGNTRFIRGKSRHPHSDAIRRQEVTQGQAPFATIITCSDSRVPPEIIFDCGIGDLFVIRVAGNIIDTVVLGSILYATEHLSCPLVVVLGHESCGAVTASLQMESETANEPTAILEILNNIRRNIPKTLASNTCGSSGIQIAVEENIMAITKSIENVKEIETRISVNTILIKPAFYKLDTGEVIWK